MKKERIALYEFGVAKNGAEIVYFPEINSIALYWKGDILLSEWEEILSHGLREIAERKITSWIADTSMLGLISDEHNVWVQENWVPKAISAGLQKLAVMLPKDVLGEMAMQELMESVEQSTSEKKVDLQYYYTNNIEDAIAWIKAH